MQRINLEKVHQNQMEFYSGKADPRVLVRMADDIQVGSIQDAQRPLKQKHLKEIAEFVGQNSRSVLPGVMIATKKNADGLLIPVQSEAVTVIHADGTRETETRYYMEFPETEDEIARYRGTINIIDGQHRIFSFRDDFRSPEFKDSTVYELTFGMFIAPDRSQRQMLFMVTNEKQQAVDPNLLYYLQDQLGLLNEKEKQERRLIERLNYEDASPLKGRIILNAETIKRGYKARELKKILRNTFPDGMLGQNMLVTEDNRYNVLCRYLEGWEIYYGLSFGCPEKDTMTKISGLRYILWMFPFFWEYAYQNKEKFNAEYVRDMVELLNECVEDTGESNGNVFEISANFRSETSTRDAARRHTSFCKEYVLKREQKEGFNPLD